MNMSNPAIQACRELAAASKHAGNILVILWALSNGKRQVNVTRITLCDISGLHKSTITTAMHALHDCGFIRRAYGCVPGRKWYRVTLLASPWAVKTVSREARKRTPKAVKSDSRGESRVTQNRLKGGAPLKPEKVTLLSRESRGPVNRPPHSPTGSGGPPAQTPVPTNTNGKINTAEPGEISIADLVRGEAVDA